MKIRQVAPDISGIRDDHVRRYQFAANKINQLELKCNVLDVGCGVGYGSKLMADRCRVDVLGIDICPETVEYACLHYHADKTLMVFLQLDMSEVDVGPFNVLTMFEVIEHSDQAPAFLAEASKSVKYLFGSVPNESVVPYVPGKVNAEHYRHYTLSEISDELEQAGWKVLMIGGQMGKKGAGAIVLEGLADYRTIVFMAESKYA